MNWSKQQQEVVGQLIQRIIRSDPNSNDSRVARQTDALPVHWDMGGCLLICVDGVVRRYDDEVQEVRSDVEPMWSLLAKAKAARKYAELSELMPIKPDGGVECDACGGLGKLGDFDCGTCFTLGWSENSDVVPP